MKKSLFFGVIVLLSFVSCEKLDKDVFLKIGNGLEYEFSDIELYDTSTHILYFKKEHNEFQDFLTESFTFLDNGESIFTGTFLPGYSSSYPSGPFIMSPSSMYGNYALKIDFMYLGNPTAKDDPKMVDVLNQNNLLHSGLAISSSSIEISGTKLTYKFTVKNSDKSDLMIIDPDKTGPNIFHYFTNGLSISDLNYNDLFTSTIQHQVPDPWNSWKAEWLSELKSGDSKQFTIIYTMNNSLNPGEYYTSFTYPGLAHQVTKNQLYQGKSRIWLGNIQIIKRISLQ